MKDKVIKFYEIIIRYIFYNTISGKENFYVINENDRLLRFNNESLMVAQSINPYLENKIKDIKYDGKNKVELVLENGESYKIENVNAFFKLY